MNIIKHSGLAVIIHFQKNKEKKNGMESKRTLLSMLISILVGMISWLFNRGTYYRDKRMPICNVCEFKTGEFCGKCGCLLEAKTRVMSEECPEGKWQS